MPRIKAEPEPAPLLPEAKFTPGSIVLYIPERSQFVTGKFFLAPHYLTREDAQKIRDDLNKALEQEAAVTAVLSHTVVEEPS